MINVLIVEDNPHKLKTIVRLVEENTTIPRDSLFCVKSVNEAKRSLLKTTFDLMILDLVLPISEDDASPKPENGAKFLEDLHINPNFKKPVHIIGLTQHPEYKNEFSSSFEKHVWQLIQYEASSQEWQDKLVNVLNHLIQVRREYLENAQGSYRYDVAVIAALREPELNAFLRLLNSYEVSTPKYEFEQYYTGAIKTERGDKTVVAACTDQMGMVAATNLATKIIFHFKPRYLIMVGIAAGVKSNDVKLGDILVAEQTWDYSNGKLAKSNNEPTENLTSLSTFLPDPKQSVLAAPLRAKMIAFIQNQTILNTIQDQWTGPKTEYKLRVHLGPVGSGSYVINNEHFLMSIKERQRKLIGIDMEAYGVYYAAEHSGEPSTQALAIKAASDFADGSKNDNFHGYAAYVSASFAYEFIVHYL